MVCNDKTKWDTGIPRFRLLNVGTNNKTAESENHVNQGYLVVLRGGK